MPLLNHSPLRTQLQGRRIISRLEKSSKSIQQEC